MAYVSTEDEVRGDPNNICAEWNHSLDQLGWNDDSNLSSTAFEESLRKLFPDMDAACTQNTRGMDPPRSAQHQSSRASSWAAESNDPVQGTHMDDGFVPLLPLHERHDEQEETQPGVIVADDPGTAAARLEALRRVHQTNPGFVSLLPQYAYSTATQCTQPPNGVLGNFLEQLNVSVSHGASAPSRNLLRDDLRQYDQQANDEGMADGHSMENMSLTKRQQEAFLDELIHSIERNGEMQTPASVNTDNVMATPKSQHQESAQRAPTIKSNVTQKKSNMQTPTTFAANYPWATATPTPPSRRDSIVHIPARPSSSKRITSPENETPNSLPNVETIDLTTEDDLEESPSKRQKLIDVAAELRHQNTRRKKTKAQRAEEIRRASLRGQTPEAQAIVEILSEKMWDGEMPLITDYVLKDFRKLDAEVAKKATTELKELEAKCCEGMASFREFVRHLERYGTLPIGSVPI